MFCSVLLATPEMNSWSAILSELKGKGYAVEIVHSGKEAQLRAYQKAFQVLILDLQLQNHSSFEVIRYFQQNFSATKIIAVAKDMKWFDSLGLTLERLKSLGAEEFILEPLRADALSVLIEKNVASESWRKVKKNVTSSQEQESSAADDDFTSIPIKEFFSGSTVVFDCYIRLGKNRYLKIINEGDSFDSNRFEKYTRDKQLEFLYFRNVERSKFINYSNSILEKAIEKDIGSTDFKMSAAKNVSQKFVEEVYTQGIKPQLIDEGRKLCSSLSKLISRERDLNKLLRDFQESTNSEFGHLYLVSFFSTVIAKNLSWATWRTIETVAMAGLFHDIGHLRLSPELRVMSELDMSEQQFAMFKQHPSGGEEMLRDFSCVSESVRQVIHQHHEFCDGTGFPNNLTGIKIYPLAKIVSLADQFSKTLEESKSPPLEGLKIFFSQREMLQKFDPAIIKALIQGFIRDSE